MVSDVMPKKLDRNYHKSIEYHEGDLSNPDLTFLMPINISTKVFKNRALQNNPVLFLAKGPSIQY